MELNKNLLHYFEDLLEYDKTNKLKDIFITECIADFGNSIEDIEIEQGIITYRNEYFDEETNQYIEGLITFDFDKHFTTQINAEYKKAKTLLDAITFDIVSNGNNPIEFLNLQMTILKSLYLKLDTLYIEKPVVRNAIVALKNYLHEKYCIDIPKLPIQKQNNHNTESSPDDYTPLSFCWDSIDDQKRIEELEHLYSLLIEKPAVIECTREDFINAFTQKKVNNGIKWLIIGRNKYSSKSALFYFINFLNNESYINTVKSTELNKKIVHVFRDNRGNLLKNIRQSKNHSSTTPTNYKRLDNIFFRMH